MKGEYEDISEDVLIRIKKQIWRNKYEEYENKKESNQSKKAKQASKDKVKMIHMKNARAIVSKSCDHFQSDIQCNNEIIAMGLRLIERPLYISLNYTT